MSTSSHPRLNKEAYLRSARDSDIERLLGDLEDSGVQCVIDLRVARSPAEVAVIEQGARSRRIHYAHLPLLSPGQPERSGQPSRALAWAARTALRYRSCLLTEGRPREDESAKQVAALVGLRLVPLGAGGGQEVDG